MNNSIEYLISNASLSYINPLICGEEKCKPSHSFGPHKRKYYLLHYVMSGKGTFKSNGNIYSVNANECFVIRPNEITYYEADKNNPWEYVWVGFTTDIPLPNAIIENDIIHNNDLRNLFLSLKSVYNIDNKKEEYLASIIFKMFQTLSLSTNTKNQLVEKAKLYIDTNYMNNISVSSIAEQLHINRSYFYKLFKKEEGISPQEYLCCFRLNQAMLMLKQTDKSISEIATTCGFSDVFVFSKAYKIKFNHSPKQERINNI
jgi:AraC-like DNA-binding protein